MYREKNSEMLILFIFSLVLITLINFSDNYFDRSILLHGSFCPHLFYFCDYVRESVCEILHMRASGFRGQRHQIFLEQELQAAVSPSMWVLRIQLRSSERAICGLNLFIFLIKKIWKYNITFLHSYLPSKPSNMSVPPALLQIHDLSIH